MTAGTKNRIESAKRIKTLAIDRADEANENSIVLSSGNVFADLRFADAEERKAKADLAIGIKNLIEKKRWSQRETAKRLGTSQPTISALWNNKLSSITYDKLTEWYLVLGKSVKIQVYTPKRNEQPRLEVAVA